MVPIPGAAGVPQSVSHLRRLAVVAGRLSGESLPPWFGSVATTRRSRRIARSLMSIVVSGYRDMRKYVSVVRKSPGRAQRTYCLCQLRLSSSPTLARAAQQYCYE